MQKPLSLFNFPIFGYMMVKCSIKNIGEAGQLVLDSWEMGIVQGSAIINKHTHLSIFIPTLQLQIKHMQS